MMRWSAVTPSPSMVRRRVRGMRSSAWPEVSKAEPCASARSPEPMLSTWPMPMAARVARPASAARRRAKAKSAARRPRAGIATCICQPSPR